MTILRLCAAWLLSTASLAVAQTPIPAHPGILRFEEPVFSALDPADYRAELPGGAIAFIAEDHTLPLVDVAVALRVGSFLDPPEQSGLASLSGSLIRRAGAADMPADEFDDRAAFLGAHLNSFAGIARGGASLNVTTPGLEEGLDLFFAMLRRPRFDPDRVEVIRRSLFENMARRNEDPLDLLEREWEWLLWGEDHFSTRPVTARTLDAIGRDDIVTFHHRYWHPANLVFAVSGDVSRERAVELLSGHLANWPASEEAARPQWPPPPPTHSPVSGPYLIEKDVPQAKVRLGHLASIEPSRVEGAQAETELAAIRVMSEVLGGSGAVSRIAGRLRTAEGLVYRATAWLDTGELWAGEFRVFFDTANRNVARAVEQCLEEIRRLQARPVHPQELQVVKESLLAELRRSFDTAEEIAGYLAEDELMDRPADFWRKRYDSIRSVTIDQVREAAARHLRPEDLIILAVGRGLEIGVGSDGELSPLERLTGRKAVRLPLRDPLTLERP